MRRPTLSKPSSPTTPDREEQAAAVWEERETAAAFRENPGESVPEELEDGQGLDRKDFTLSFARDFYADAVLLLRSLQGLLRLLVTLSVQSDELVS